MEIMYSNMPLENKQKSFQESKINEKFNKCVNLAYIISLIVVIAGYITFNAVYYRPKDEDKTAE